MKKLRKILIKYMYSSYMVKLFGKSFSFKRAANIHMPIMFIIAYGILTEGFYEFNLKEQLITTIGLVLFALSTFISIYYFNKYKVNFEELEKEQKLFRGYQHLRMPGIEGLTISEFKEWKSIVREFKSNTDKFRNVIAFLVNIVVTIIFFVLIYIS